MSAIHIFQIPGRFALELILAFFQYPAREFDPGLALVFSFLLALLFWTWLLSVCIAIIKRQFGFGHRGRY